MKAPQRLLDDPEMARALRSDLVCASENCSGTYDTKTGLLRLRQGLAAAGGMAAQNACIGTSSGLFGINFAKLGIAGAVATVIGALLLSSGKEELEELERDSSAQTVPVEFDGSSPQTESAEAVESNPVIPELEQESSKIESEESAELLPHHEPTAGHGASQTSARESMDRSSRQETKKVILGEGQPKGELPMQSEIAHLARIRTLLSSEPAAAYRLAQEGHREYADGFLRHEREGLAILALDKQGRHREAADRARIFSERYPHSPLLPKLKALEHLESK